MLRITRETDYGIVLMSALVDGDSHSAATLAKQCQLPVPMVSKILKALTQEQLLSSQRGAQGGYSLARPAADISVADIIEALEGPIALTECSHSDPAACCYRQQCGVSHHWNRINAAVRTALQRISLQEMGRKPPLHSPQTIMAINVATNLRNGLA